MGQSNMDQLSEIEKYLRGYVSQNVWQKSDVKGDPQIAALNPIIMFSLENLSPNATTIFDIGMGSGLLARNLANLSNFQENKQVYVGIDISIDRDALYDSGIKTGLLPKERAKYLLFKDLDTILSQEWNDIVVVLRNIFHEIDLFGLAKILHVFSNIKCSNLKIIIQDMESLPVAEIGNAPWTNDMIAELLLFVGFSKPTTCNEVSRSSTPWFTIWSHREKTINHELHILLNRIIYMRRNQLHQLFDRGIKLISAENAPSLDLLKIQNDTFGINTSLAVAERTYYEIVSNKLTNRKGKIKPVTWNDILTKIDEYISKLTKKYDLILGIDRGGLPIAVVLSHRMNDAKVASMLKSYMGSKAEPFFVFDDNNRARSERKRIIESFILPPLRGEIQNVLVVDDVTTFGNTLETAELLLRTSISPNLNVDFYTYAADLNRLSISKPDLSKRLYTSSDIDNQNVWLSFPWEQLR